MFNFFRFLYKALNKISPTFANLIAGWYSTISGWRFHDLKIFFESKLSKSSNLCLLAKMRTLEAIEGNLERVGKVAYVSPMPPEDTGISSFTFYAFRGAGEEVDIFCRPYSDDVFLSLTSRLRSKSVRLLDVELLLYADELLNYKKIFISLGNSHHHYYLWDLFAKCEFFGLVDKCVIYAHDPYLNNLIQSGLNLSTQDYVEMISDAYGLSGDVADQLATISTKWKLHAALYDLGITGARLMVRKGFTKFLVNSKSAKLILERDLETLPAQISEIFHPVFEPTTFSLKKSTTPAVHSIRDHSRDLVFVGTFGVPGYSKGTHIVIDAVRQLQARHNNVRLIVAGYGVGEYFKKIYPCDDECIIKIDSPTDEILYSLMCDVDMAVQLRLNDTGESSGVVPQLLMAGKKVIVSPVGSFQEYGNLVEYLNDTNASALSELIHDFMNRSPNIHGMDVYCGERSPEKFRQALLAYSK